MIKMLCSRVMTKNCIQSYLEKTMAVLIKRGLHLTRNRKAGICSRLTQLEV